MDSVFDVVPRIFGGLVILGCLVGLVSLFADGKWSAVALIIFGVAIFLLFPLVIFTVRHRKEIKDDDYD